MVRGGAVTRVLKGIIELSWTVLKNTRDLLGDLLGAKTRVLHFVGQSTPEA
jgi:hypothetical protein